MTCGLVLRDPMPSGEELAQLYEGHYSDLNVGTGSTAMTSKTASLQSQARFIARMVSSGGRVLDLGAGTGYLTRLLRDRGFDVDAVEISENARRAARRQHDIGAWPSIRELTQGGAIRYDMIVAIEVIEHLTRPWDDLRQLFGLLKDGGRLYITTPNRKGLRARLAGGDWREARKLAHLYLFDFTSLEYLLREAGYTSIRRVRFSPLTSSAPTRRGLHRILQLFGLYGGLRVTAERPSTTILRGRRAGRIRHRADIVPAAGPHRR